jgi:hypothetical protein
MSTETEKYRSAALMNFSLLKPIYGRNGNFWRLGNSFDTIVDFFDFVDSTDARVFAEYALDRYDKTKGDWFDDFGWWGIAGLKASQRPKLFPGFIDRFKEIAANSWKTMNENAPNVWAKADQKKYANYAPRFDGGCWNAYWRDDCNPINPCDGLQGVQNTVTNGLFLVLSARLGSTGRADCQQAASREYAFLKLWFDASSPPDRLLPRTPDGGAWVRERVSAYESGIATHAYRPTLAWSGDQGLILGGLVDRMILEPKSYAEMIAIARALVTGVRGYLFRQDMILLPWRAEDGGGAPGGDDDDYMTGASVIMRYLLYAYRINADLKTSLQQAGYLDVIRVNADKACEYPDLNQGDDKALILLTNNLATLTAAVSVLNG